MSFKILKLGLLNFRSVAASNSLQLTSIQTRLSEQPIRILNSTTTALLTAWSWSTTDIAVRIFSPYNLSRAIQLLQRIPTIWWLIQFLLFSFFFKTAAYNLPAYYPKKKTPHITGGGMGGIYQFAQIHLHWGNDSTKGSEHLINSKRYF